MAPRCLISQNHHSSSEKEHLTSSSPRGTSSSSTIFWYATYRGKMPRPTAQGIHWEKRKPGKKKTSFPKWCFNLMLPSSPNMDIYSYYMILIKIYIYVCVLYCMYCICMRGVYITYWRYLVFIMFAMYIICIVLIMCIVCILYSMYIRFSLLLQYICCIRSQYA